MRASGASGVTPFAAVVALFAVTASSGAVVVAFPREHWVVRYVVGDVVVGAVYVWRRRRATGGS